jgi:hypothetical protein
MRKSDSATSRTRKLTTRKRTPRQMSSNFTIAGFIEHQFRRKITVTENGIKMRRTILEVIVMQLCRAEAAGKRGATRALLKYKELGGDRRKNMKIIVEGGLPRPKKQPLRTGVTK